MTKHHAERAAEILDVIADYSAEYGYAPSVREIMERVGLASTSAVQYHLTKLRKDGLIEEADGRARALVAHREPKPELTADRLELAWCYSVHGAKPPKVRPCKRHRLMAEWLVEVVIPTARAIA